MRVASRQYVLAGAPIGQLPQLLCRAGLGERYKANDSEHEPTSVGGSRITDKTDGRRISSQEDGTAPGSSATIKAIDHQ